MDGEDLARIGDALAAEPDRQLALERLLTEARRLTRAEAGTVYVRENNRLRFAAVQNDVLARRLGQEEVRRRLAAEPLPLLEPSVASYVALARAEVNIADVYELPPERPYTFDRYMDVVHGYRTRSMLALPLRDGRGEVFGVIQLINALDPAGTVVAFGREGAELVGALLAQFARALAARGRGSASAG
jgi:GAF domain-containing protein